MIFFLAYIAGFNGVMIFFFFFFFFFMNGNTERAQCALSQVCIPWKKEKKCNKTIV